MIRGFLCKNENEQRANGIGTDWDEIPASRMQPLLAPGAGPCGETGCLPACLQPSWSLFAYFWC